MTSSGRLHAQSVANVMTMMSGVYLRCRVFFCLERMSTQACDTLQELFSTSLPEESVYPLLKKETMDPKGTSRALES